MGQDVINVTDRDSRVGEVVRQRLDSLSPAERRLARVLLASYPIAGLESVARFAERAGVSPPTVTRFITKLGFKGYPEFQESLRHEVQARLSSPLARYRDEPKHDSAVNHALEVSTHNLKATTELLSDRDVKEAVVLLADVRRRVMILAWPASSTCCGQGSAWSTPNGARPRSSSSTCARRTCWWCSTTGATSRTRSRAPGSHRAAAAT